MLNVLIVMSLVVQIYQFLEFFHLNIYSIRNSSNKRIDTRKITVSSLKDREDTSLVSNFILKGDINQLLPFLKKINKDNNFYYTMSLRESNVNSTISSYEIKRSFGTIGISKRINFND